MQTNQPKRSATVRASSWEASKTCRTATRCCATPQNEVRGYYEAEGDHTRDAQQNIVAKGNKLRSMIC